MNINNQVRVQNSYTPNTTPQKTDSKNKTITQRVSDKIQNNKKSIVLTGLASIPIIFFTVAIGRDPVKAAKYLKGNPNNISDKAYKKGMEFVEQITNNESLSKLLNVDIKQYIHDCPKELLPKDGIFYHGTKSSSKIYKHGFTPYASNQLSFFAREFGAGVYLTPEEKVAQNFKMVAGKVIPVKVEDAKIAVIDPKDYDTLANKAAQFMLKRKSTDKKETPNMYKFVWSMLKNRKTDVAAQEILVQKLFTQLGYDGVYMSKGYTSSILKDIDMMNINKIIGQDQSQLVLFNPEKLTIQSRSFKDRVLDIGKGTKAFFRMNKNILTACKNQMNTNTKKATC